MYSLPATDVRTHTQKARGALARRGAVFSGPMLRLARVGEGFEGEVKVRKYQKKGLDTGDFEQLGNTIVDPGEDDLPASFLAGDVGADQRTKPGRIDVGNV